MAGRRKTPVAARILPRHAPFYWGVAMGALAFVVCLFLSPRYAVAVGANAMFILSLIHI